MLLKHYHKKSMRQLVKTVATVMFVYFFLFFVMLEVLRYHKSDANNSSASLPFVVVHLDLKGSPPKLPYLESLLPALKQHGANGLMMEYEDMFPYHGDLVNLSARYCYKRDELRQFLTKAVKSGFEIIPLIQTFGHMEHVLKLQEFKYLRENPSFPDSICPSRRDSRALLKQMAQQVIDFHLDISPLKYIHIGSDEVYHINTCQICKSRQLKTEDLFLQHVIQTSSDIKLISLNATILIWDDMMRNIMPKYMKSYNLRLYVEPIYWDYRAKLRVSHITLYRYYQTFNNLWIASAFKGADGRTATQPILKERLQNNYNWMKFIQGYKFGDKQPVAFKGIILTGWSRYSHFDPLCELLPTSLPSLLMNLITIKESKRHDIQKINAYDFYAKFVEGRFQESLHCWYKEQISLKHNNISKCHYNGHKVYDMLRQYVMKDNKHFAVSCFERLQEKKVFLNHYTESNSTNPNNLQTDRGYFEACLEYIDKVKYQIENVLKPYYEDFVIKEYTYSKLGWFQKQLNETLLRLKMNSNVTTWSRKSNI